MAEVATQGTLVLTWRGRYDDEAVVQRVEMPADTLPLVGDYVELGHGPVEHRGLYRVEYRRLEVGEDGDARWYAHALVEM